MLKFKMIKINNAGYKQVLRAVSEEYEIKISDLLSKSRKPRLTRARMEVIRILREPPFSYSYPDIGEILKKDHTSVIYNYKKYKLNLQENNLLKS